MPARESAGIGKNPSAVGLDEIHMIAQSQNGSKLIASTKTAIHTGAREDTLVVYCTTAPLQKATGAYNTLIERARSVLDGSLDDPHFLPVFFELPLDADLTDPDQWWKANPGLGTTVRLPALITAHATAQAASDPSELRNFRTQNLNVIVPETHAEGFDRWIPGAALPEYYHPTIRGLDRPWTRIRTSTSALIWLAKLRWSRCT